MNAYFKLTSGPVYDTVKEFCDRSIAAREDLKAWTVAHNLPVTASRGKALTFEDGYTPDPKLWRKTKHDDWLPSKTTKAGKLLAQELDDVPCVEGCMSLLLRITALTGKDDDIMQVNRTGTAGCRTSDSVTYYLSIDTCWLNDDRTGMEEITASAYAAGYQPKTEQPTEPEHADTP